MKNKLYTEHINHLHLEPTTRCNAACTQCARNVWGSSVTPTEMFDAEFKPEWFDKFRSFVFEHVTISGNYGDIIRHSDPLGFLTAIKDRWPTVSLQINTNGAALDPKIWYAIGGLGWRGRGCLPVKIEFGIDGATQETHSRYRKNTRLDRILENAESFIRGGGIARWVFTEFQHNSHEIEQARSMARELGFDEFWVRPSSRQIDGLPTPVVDDAMNIIDWMHQPGETKPGFTRAYQNGWKQSLLKEKTLGKHSVSRTDVTQLPYGGIDCWATKTKSIYVDARGYIYPCCWLGRPQVWKNSTKLLGCSTDFNSIADDAVIHIMENKFWEKLDRSLVSDCLSVCDRTCGAGNKFSEQEVNTTIESFKHEKPMDFRVQSHTRPRPPRLHWTE